MGPGLFLGGCFLRTGGEGDELYESDSDSDDDDDEVLESLAAPSSSESISPAKERHRLE